MIPISATHAANHDMSDTPLRFSLALVEKTGQAPVDVAVPADLFSGALAEGKLAGQVRVEGVISRVDDDAVFEGEASGRAAYECSLCLARVERDWREPVTATVPADRPAIDLFDDVRQAVALSEPMKVFCRTDCRGLCSVCRADRNKTDCGHAVDAPPSSRPRLTPRRHKG